MFHIVASHSAHYPSPPLYSCAGVDPRWRTMKRVDRGHPTPSESAVCGLFKDTKAYIQACVARSSNLNDPLSPIRRDTPDTYSLRLGCPLCSNLPLE